MSVVMVLLIVLPLVATLVCIRAPHRVAAAVTALTGIISFILALALVPEAKGHTISGLHYLRADALSVIFLLATCFLYAAVGVYSVGYLADEERAVRFETAEQQALFARHSARFTRAQRVCVVDDLCSLGQRPCVAVDRHRDHHRCLRTAGGAGQHRGGDRGGMEVRADRFVGVGHRPAGDHLHVLRGCQALGQSYDLAFDPLISAAAQLPQTPVRLAFVLAVVGFGTKVGFFPVHTWLPDAHAEAPTPVSALLSGSLLAVSFYAILRYYQIATGTLGTRFPQIVLLVFGVLSLLLAALYLLEQRDIKRLLAYSSVEHMGILAIGVSFGAPIALSGVLLHVLAHAAAKGNAFMGAGVLVRKFGTKELGRMTRGIELLPWSGPLFLIAVLALSAMPPFGLFRSEFQIVAGGFAHGRNVLTSVLVCLVTLAFLGLSLATTRILFRPETDDSADAAPALTRGEPSRWMVAPVVAGVLVLLVLGLAPPPDLVELLNSGARELLASTP